MMALAEAIVRLVGAGKLKYPDGDDFVSSGIVVAVNHLCDNATHVIYGLSPA